MDGIQDHAMKQKIENVLSKVFDELMDIYFARIQNTGVVDKEKYLLQAAVDVENFIWHLAAKRIVWRPSVENTAIHGLPETLDDLVEHPGESDLSGLCKRHPGNFSI